MTQDQRSGRRRRRGKRLRSLGRNGPLAPAAGPPFRQAAIMSCCLARRRPLKEALSRRAAARQTRPQFQVLQEPFQACSARWGRVKCRTAQQLFTLDAPNMGRILFFLFFTFERHFCAGKRRKRDNNSNLASNCPKSFEFWAVIE